MKNYIKNNGWNLLLQLSFYEHYHTFFCKLVIETIVNQLYNNIIKIWELKIMKNEKITKKSSMGGTLQIEK